MIVQYALLKCYTILQHRDSSVNIRLPPDQHHCSDEVKWKLGGLHVIIIGEFTGGNNIHISITIFMSYDAREAGTFRRLILKFETDIRLGY